MKFFNKENLEKFWWLYLRALRNLITFWRVFLDVEILEYIKEIFKGLYILGACILFFPIIFIIPFISPILSVCIVISDWNKYNRRDIK